MFAFVFGWGAVVPLTVAAFAVLRPLGPLGVVASPLCALLLIGGTLMWLRDNGQPRWTRPALLAALALAWAVTLRVLI